MEKLSKINITYEIEKHPCSEITCGVNQNGNAKCTEILMQKRDGKAAFGLVIVECGQKPDAERSRLILLHPLFAGAAKTEDQTAVRAVIDLLDPAVQKEYQDKQSEK